MTFILLYLFGALAVSFLCSVLEAVLLSTPVSFISMKESQGDRTAALMMSYKTNVDRPVAAILTKCFSPKIQPLTVSREEVAAMVNVGADEGVFYADEALASYSRVPGYDSRREFITGYVRRAAVLEKLSQDKFDETMDEIARPVLFFPETEKVSEIWQHMLEKKEHISVITDEYGCMRGIVTMEDVIESMLGVEIVDECDTTEDLQALAHRKFAPAATV